MATICDSHIQSKQNTPPLPSNRNNSAEKEEIEVRCFYVSYIVEEQKIDFFFSQTFENIRIIIETCIIFCYFFFLEREIKKIYKREMHLNGCRRRIK